MAASPALRRLFGRVIDAVGSAVAGTQDVSARIPSIEVDGLKQGESTGDIGDIHCRLKGQHLPLDKTFEPGHEQDGSCSNGTWPSSCHLE